MDQVKVDEEREAPPLWANPRTDPSRATDKQVKFIDGLIRERDLSKLNPDQREYCELWLEHGPVRPSKSKASAMITALQLLDKAPRQSKQDIALPDVPAGRYAIEANDGELRFYKVWIGRNGFVKMYVLHGPDETQMNFKTTKTILEKIQRAGVRECAIRYGLEIGQCSNCGRRLTNRISRNLGIGPVCGGRMFGETFGDMAADERAAIIARGEDPDEELD